MSGRPQNFSARAQAGIDRLESLTLEHRCAEHPLFDFLTEAVDTDRAQVAALLKNYDAHASVLRRLLLKVCTIMPDEAVGFVLENVRNEYGNGLSEDRHQNQLRDLARQAGVTESLWRRTPVRSGVREFIKRAGWFYTPHARGSQAPAPSRYCRSAIAAGAITATEILALQEFRSMQILFARKNLGEHVWFDHVTVEAEHKDESLALAAYFIEKGDALEAVEWGLNGILEANLFLYEGLLEAAQNREQPATLSRAVELSRAALNR